MILKTKVEKTAMKLYSKDKSLARQLFSKYSKDMAQKAMSKGDYLLRLSRQNGK